MEIKEADLNKIMETSHDVGVLKGKLESEEKLADYWRGRADDLQQDNDDLRERAVKAEAELNNLKPMLEVLNNIGGLADASANT